MLEWLYKFISPTGLGIRVDADGDGHFGAKRGERKHRGVDFLCLPGQIIWSPIEGMAMRHAHPYADQEYDGLLISGDGMQVMVLYFKPNEELIGTYIQQHQGIGIAEDVTKRYPKAVHMQPHVHVNTIVNEEYVDCVQFMDPEFLKETEGQDGRNS